MFADDIGVLTTEQVAQRMGISERMLRDWEADDGKLSSCILRRTKRSTYWSVQWLRDRGYLPRLASLPADESAAVAPAAVTA